jgi:CubicO group peptidase (beta-lactamase class C family)
LAVEGKIDLNVPIGAHLAFLPPKLAIITANQLLSHTAGLHDEAPPYGSHDDSALGSSKTAAKRSCGSTDHPLSARPGLRSP